LATNLILERIGYDAATAAWRASGAEQSIVARPIEDRAAADQGIANLVTAADVAALLGAIAQDAITQGAISQGAQTRGTVANRDSCRDMLDILLARAGQARPIAGDLTPSTRGKCGVTPATWRAERPPFPRRWRARRAGSRPSRRTPPRPLRMRRAGTRRVPRTAAVSPPDLAAG